MKNLTDISNLGLPKKVAASIKNTPARVGKEKLPDELKHFLQTIIQKQGVDTATDCAQIYAPLRERFAKEFKGRSIADSLAHAQKILNGILTENSTFSATVPVVLNRLDTEKSELVGSGVLVRIVNRAFLLTAAHVIDYQGEGTLLIPGQQGFMPVSGYFSAINLPVSGNRGDDKFDAAYYWLDDDCVNDLHSKCKILEHEHISLEAEPLHCMDYTFAGYPWRKSNAKVGGIETNFNTMTGGEVKKSVYEALGLTPARHIVIEFRRQRTFNFRTSKVITSPLPHGMSGGGIYVWSEKALKSQPVCLPLVGIANTYIHEKSLLIGTRLHVYIRGIFQNNPDLEAIVDG